MMNLLGFVYFFKMFDMIYIVRSSQSEFFMIDNIMYI